MRFFTLIFLFLYSSLVFALSNEDFKVTQVDVTKGLGVVWVDLSGKTIANQPTCNGRKFGLIACDLNDVFCKTMISIALTAKATSGLVDFDYDGQCIGNFSTADRFRLSY